jgi:hypothetical protein
VLGGPTDGAVADDKEEKAELGGVEPMSVGERLRGTGAAEEKENKSAKKETKTGNEKGWERLNCEAGGKKR